MTKGMIDKLIQYHTMCRNELAMAGKSGTQEHREHVLEIASLTKLRSDYDQD